MTGLSREVQQEFRNVVSAQLDALYRTAMRMLRDHYEAEDAVQESLDKGWRKLDQFDPGTQMKPWLFKILTNTCLDTIRAKKRQAQRVADDALDPNDMESPQRLPEQMLSDSQLGSMIDTAVGQLPADQQVVVQLIVVEQLSYAQTAEALNLPVGTVRSRLSRARKSITEILADETSGSRPNGLRLVR